VCKNNAFYTYTWCSTQNRASAFAASAFAASAFAASAFAASVFAASAFAASAFAAAFAASAAVSPEHVYEKGTYNVPSNVYFDIILLSLLRLEMIQ
jgi:hypothetical protein